MSDTNPTPADAIPFALVDESGHLTGKPAEGVTAMIRAATEELKVKLSEATTKAGISEPEVVKIIGKYEADILKAWQADPAYTKMASSIRHKQIWKNVNASQRPGELWLYLLSTLNAATVAPADLMGYLTGQVVAGNSFAPVSWEELSGGEEPNTEFLDYFDGASEGIDKLLASQDGHSDHGVFFWVLAVQAISAISTLRKIELDGNYLKVTTKAGTPVYIPVLREKPGA